MDQVNAKASFALLERLQRRPSEFSILTLWREKMDTFDIAQALGVHESEIANRLTSIRSKSRGVANA